MMHLLVVDWTMDPVLFSLGGIEIRYYGLMWVLALLGGAKFFEYFVHREGLPQSVSDSIFWYGTLGTILGARIGHCLFYDPAYYLSHPLEIITGFRDGGLASHGAALGLLVGLWLFSKRIKMPYIWSLDRIMIPVGIGGALVRLGNLFNSEIFGATTSLPWGFRFLRSGEWQRCCAPEACHPTQLYEAFCYLVTFILLCWLYTKKDMGRRRPGLLFGVGLIGVFFTRFLIEYVKLEQGGADTGLFLKMGQLLSIPFVIMGVVLVVVALRRPEAEPLKAEKPLRATLRRQNKAK